ncbi:hypothetical protein CAPTEDRAFT_148219 [Capitella teleta]|uniref:THAP-type domain-containing protein n=1 Tax=Capitella teleta TaxID=283909 RepID=R7VLH2_CAPTE|nr:hypothetical protein CAPTEDRAFT_148219 [Capitella teleta]|eukprot:ELU18256.1 hypothetical protein CAPTEDRAFT_148219 [Capitella teleta]
MPKRCAIPGCGTYSDKDLDLSFHRFPKDEDVRYAWLTAARMPHFEPTSNCVLCSCHFDDSVFTTNEKQRTPSRTAVPVKFPWSTQLSESDGDSNDNKSALVVSSPKFSASEHGYNMNREVLKRKLEAANNRIKSLEKDLHNTKRREKRAKTMLSSVLKK